MSKDNKNTENHYVKVLKTLSIIAVIALITYAIMAIITHFSLNFESDNYKFNSSIISVFDTETAIFKFFIGFMILNISWLAVSVSIFFIKKLIIKSKYEQSN